MIEFKLLHNYATIPTRATSGSAGFDLYTTDPVICWPGQIVKIPTGIACALPEGTAGFVWPRSSMAVNYGFAILAGVVDADFRGEVHVVGVVMGERPMEVRRGERIAQMVVKPIETQSQEVTELPDTTRGVGGFGSTVL